MVMYPAGHARNNEVDLEGILDNKFRLLGKLALNEEDLDLMMSKLNKLESLSNIDLKNLYSCNIKYAEKSIDDWLIISVHLTYFWNFLFGFKVINILNFFNILVSIYF